MSVTVSNLLQGPAVVYVGPFGTTEPANADAVPAVGWVDVGGTDGGAKATINQSYSNMTVDQVAIPVGSRLQTQEVSVSTTMAEATLANLRAALNLTTGAGTFLEIDPTISNAEPNYCAVLLKGQRPGGGSRLIIVRRALSTANFDMSFDKGTKTMIPVTFTGFYVSSAVKPIRIDDTPGP